MTTADHTIRARWIEAHEEYAAADATAVAAEASSDDRTISGAGRARHSAWLTMMHAPAPDAGALACKLAELVAIKIEDEHFLDIDDIANLQWLLDDATAQDLPGHIVALWQDALRLAGIDHPVLALERTSNKGWSDLADRYREALATFLSTVARKIDPKDDVSDSVLDEAERVIRPLYNAMLRYPVWTVEQLAEKGELIQQDCRDDREAFEALTADAMRIAKL